MSAVADRAGGSGALGRGRGGLAVEPRIRLRTLVLWRWLAVAGQTATLLVVYGLFGYDLPLWPCLGAVIASAWLNIVVTLGFPFGRRLGDGEAAAYLAYDLLQLGVLLYLTGGLANPFTIFSLVPATIAATSLSLRATVVIGGLTIAMVTALTIHAWPLPWRPGETLETPTMYLAGNWLALVIGLVFLAGYAFRLSQEARHMIDALAAAQRALESEQRLSAVGALAAAAAHELGTPLATITLVAKELARDLPPDGAHGEDLRLLISQTDRCREILARLSRAPESADEEARLAARQPVGVLIHEAADPHRDFGIDIEIRRGEARPDARTGEGEPSLPRSPELMHGLGNFIENAVDFARERVEIEVRWSDLDLWVRIIDDGPGFAPSVLDRLGEPYLTTRGDEARRAALDLPIQGPRDLHDRHVGMGLGVFIAKTLLERTGAQITFANGAKAGAIVAIHWSRAALDADGDPPTEANQGRAV